MASRKLSHDDVKAPLAVWHSAADIIERLELVDEDAKSATEWMEQIEEKQLKILRHTRESRLKDIQIPEFTRNKLPALPVEAEIKRAEHYIVKQDLPRYKWDSITEYELDEEDEKWVSSGKGVTELQLVQALDRLEKAHFGTIESLAASSQEIDYTQLEQETVNGSGNTIQKALDITGECWKAVVQYWKEKRAQNYERHKKQAQEMTMTMQGRSSLADWNNPRLFPLRALRETCGLLVSWNSGFIYSLCDHLFLIARLQNEYKLTRNIRTCNFGRPRRAIRSRAQSSQQDNNAAWAELLEKLRKEMEQARILLHCVISRERFKQTEAQLNQQIFTQQLILKKRKRDEPTKHTTTTTTTTATTTLDDNVDNVDNVETSDHTDTGGEEEEDEDRDCKRPKRDA